MPVAAPSLKGFACHPHAVQHPDNERRRDEGGSRDDPVVNATEVMQISSDSDLSQDHGPRLKIVHLCPSCTCAASTTPRSHVVNRDQGPAVSQVDIRHWSGTAGW
jgi:hypothetical protein